MPPKIHNSFAVLQILFAWSIFASWGIIAREIDLPLPIMLFFICAGGLLTSLFFVKGKVGWNMTSFVVAIILVFDLLLLFAAFQRISFATTITLHYAGPILVVALSPFILNEKFSVRNLVLTVLGFIFVLALTGAELNFWGEAAPIDSSKILGVLFALLSAVTLAGNIIYQRKNMVDTGSYGNAVFQYNCHMSTIYFLLIPFWIGVFSDNLFASLNVEPVLLLYAFLAGIITQGFAMLLFNSAARFLNSQTIAKMAFSEVALVTVLGSLIYSETLGLMKILCIVGIVVLTYLAQAAEPENQ